MDDLPMREEDYGTDSGEQFRGQMHLQDDPFNMAFGYTGEVVTLLQDGGRARILFESPAMLRQIANGCLKVAEMWERGELKAP